MRVLNLGFVGLGQAVNRILYQHPEVRALPYRFAAAADPRAEAVKAFSTEFGAKGYSTAEELMADPGVDVVYIATPPGLHREHAELAAAHGKHMIVEKPLGLSLSDVSAMCDAADRAGVRMLAGHTHSFDAPIREIARIVREKELGDLLTINTWNFNSFNAMPWPTAELHETAGPVLNQGPHQIDIVRQIAGGMVTQLQATTFPDHLRGVVGGYTCHLQFAEGTSATLVYDARGFFDTAELHGWVAEGGQDRAPDMNHRMRSNARRVLSSGSRIEADRVFESQKDQGRYGVQEVNEDVWSMWGYSRHEETRHQPFFGFTVVSCEHGAIRQSPDGLIIYGEEGRREIPLPTRQRARAAELQELYDGIVHDRPVFHDGRWGMATLEACLGILESSRTGQALQMKHQVPAL